MVEYPKNDDIIYFSTVIFMCEFKIYLITSAKEIFHIISFEPISESLTSKSFHESSVKLVRIDVIGSFWKATTVVVSHNSNTQSISFSTHCILVICFSFI